jgi:hypothetical protein
MVHHNIRIKDIGLLGKEQYKVREAVPLRISLPCVITSSIRIVCFEIAVPFNLADTPKVSRTVPFSASVRSVSDVSDFPFGAVRNCPRRIQNAEKSSESRIVESLGQQIRRDVTIVDKTSTPDQIQRCFCDVGNTNM